MFIENIKYSNNMICVDARLWDPDDVSRESVVTTETKETVKVHLMSALHTIEEEEHGPWLSELGIDDHSAMSLTAGILRSPFNGAWKYASDRADWKENSNRGTEVAVHCRSSSKKVSVDPKSQMEIICRPERIIKSQATHVVVSISYGLESFCIFKNPEVSTNNDDGSEKTQEYANFFANCLLDGKKMLGNDKDGDEEDGGHCLFPSDLHCILYKDVFGVKKGQSWTTNTVAEQYEACRKILGHQATRAVPLKIWLYPLQKLLPTEVRIIKLLDNGTDVSRDVVIKCQMMWNNWVNIRLETDAIKTEMSKLERSTTQHSCWIPLAVSKRIHDFDKCLNEFMSAMQKYFYEWTISVRRGDDPEEKKMAEMVEVIEKKSPFIPKEIKNWLNNHNEQMKTLATLSQLPGVRLVTEMKKLEREVEKSGPKRFAVVLHLTSVSEQSNKLLQVLMSYADAITKSHPAQSSKLIREGKFELRAATDRRRFVSVAQEFSDWVANNNSDTPNVHFIIFYNEQPVSSDVKLPFMRLYHCTLDSCVNFTIPKAPGPVEVEKNHRGVITLSWTTEEEVDQLSFLLQYRSIDGSEEKWDSIQHNSTTITINYLLSEESYVFRVATVTSGGRSPFSPVSCEVMIDPVCHPPTGLQCDYVTDTSITISWDHVVIDEEDAEEIYYDATDEEDYDNKSSDFDVGSICNRMFGSKDTVGYEKETENVVAKKNVKLSITCYSIDCWMASNPESTFIRRSTTEKMITLEPLILGTTYCIQVRAVCTDVTGSTFHSPATLILETETLEEAERASAIVRRVSKKCPVGPGIVA